MENKDKLIELKNIYLKLAECIDEILILGERSKTENIDNEKEALMGKYIYLNLCLGLML